MAKLRKNQILITISDDKKVVTIESGIEISPNQMIMGISSNSPKEGIKKALDLFMDATSFEKLPKSIKERCIIEDENGD